MSLSHASTFRRRWLLAFAALLATSLLGSSASACFQTHPPVLPWLGNWEDTNLFYLRAQSATSGPFLGTEAGTSPNGYTDAQLGPTSGAQSLTGGPTGSGRTSVTFALTPALANDLYLNLSKPIIGKLFFASTLTTTHPSVTRGDGMQIRFEVFTGAKRVAGFDYLVTAQSVRNSWGALNFCLRAESRTLDAGQPITVKVTRLSSFADFQIGVGGAQQSYVEVHTFRTDPLAGAYYVEGKTLVRLPDSGSPSGEEAPAAAAGLPLLALLGFAFRPRRFAATLAVAVLLGGALAGCLGGGKPEGNAGESSAARPSVSVTYETRPAPTSGATTTPTHTGSVEGVVVNPLGIPIKDAAVLAAGTNLYMKTNDKGQFRFDNMTPGTYLFRVDKEGFVSFEDNITVLEGVVTKATITLTYPEAKQANDKPHWHDDWEGDKERTIWSKSFAPEWQYTPIVSTKDLLSTTAHSPPKPAGTPQAPDPYRTQNCPALGTCEYTLELPENAYILPGTGMVELTLQWSKTGNGAPQEMSLSFLTATNTSQANRLVARGPNDPFRIAIFPHEADPGHLKFTDWTFTLKLPPLEHSHPFGVPGYLATTIQFTLKIYKGVVPYERAHADFWQGATELELFKASTLGPRNCSGCDFPEYSWVWTPGAGKFVPPDTLELRGTLKWSGTLMSQSAVNGAWTIAYRPANVQFRESALPSYPRVTITKTGADNIEFKIVPKAGEPDQYYQKTSRWKFLLDDGDKPQKGAYVGYQDTWQLTLTAYKAP